VVFQLTEDERKETVQLTKDLISIPSTARDGDEIYKFARDFLVDRGLVAELQSMRSPHLEYQDHCNLVARMGDGGHGGPRIMLNGHLDTVQAGEGWFHDPYSGHEEGGKIFGLGSSDMKGGCAAAMMAVAALADRLERVEGELMLTLVFGEEAPFSLGVDALLREYPLEGYDLTVVTEPSPLLAINDYCVVHKRLHKKPAFPVAIVGAEGRVLFEVELQGRSSHASHPSQGINALHGAARIITKLQDFDMYSNIKMGRGHYVVLNIEGGGQTFTVPNWARILVNRQLTLGETEETVTEELWKLIRSLRLRSKVTVRKRFSPAPELEYKPYLNETSEYLDMFVSNLPRPKRGRRCRLTTSSVGDFNLIATRTNCPVLVFGPGGGDIHAPNEFVNRDEVVATADHLLDFLVDVHTPGSG
jgi:acetylornithine deacetylase/succinyl-diaminopimelate desuccinylase-like protein